MMRSSHRENWFAQQISDFSLFFLGRPKTFTAKLSLALTNLARRFAIKFLGDPLVKYSLDGSTLLIPLSHELPYIRAVHNEYSKNIGRIAKILKGKYSNITMIDIGANVGDTVAIARGQTRIPVLCIDGNPNYQFLLKKNSAEWKEVQIEYCYVGDTNSTFAGHIEAGKGTAHLVLDPDSQFEIETKTLMEILKSHPVFLDAKLIKIDTDGFDTKIIKSNLEFFKKNHPVLFFEYDPHFFNDIDPCGFSVFMALKDAGYSTALFYENTGEYLAKSALDNVDLLKDMHHFCRKTTSIHKYCDVCIFSDSDEDILNSIRIEALN